MKRLRGAALLSLLSVSSACGGAATRPAASSERTPATTSPPDDGERKMATTYADDLAFLNAHGVTRVLVSKTGGRVVVSPAYQARVMTSAVGEDGTSLGWIHRKFIAAGKTGTVFDNYGGEDRFWLGPEAGQFGLWFAPGAPYEFAQWHTPRGLQEGEWRMTASDDSHLTFVHDFALTNHAGTEFAVGVERTVRLLESADVALPAGVKMVAYATENRITNRGEAPWTPERGLLSVWILGMFAPAKDAKVIVPFEPQGEGPIVNDAYFGKVPADRLKVHDRFLVFTCDGDKRSKIGLGPHRAKPMLGSYVPSMRLLTVITYDKPVGAAGERYVNSMWEEQKDPYDGDVVNSYNDGEVGPGQPSLGGFYEIETSSPAAALAPGQSLVHTHRTFHFVGDAAQLDVVSKALLGVSLADVAR